MVSLHVVHLPLWMSLVTCCSSFFMDDLGYMLFIFLYGCLWLHVHLPLWMSLVTCSSSFMDVLGYMLFIFLYGCPWLHVVHRPLWMSLVTCCSLSFMDVHGYFAKMFSFICSFDWSTSLEKFYWMGVIELVFIVRLPLGDGEVPNVWQIISSLLHIVSSDLLVFIVRLPLVNEGVLDIWQAVFSLPSYCDLCGILNNYHYNKYTQPINKQIV